MTRTIVVPAKDENKPADLLAWQIRQMKLPVPVREHKFAADIKRKFAFDFCWTDLKLAVEVDGGVWSGGRHTRGAGFTSDCEKSCLASIRRWVVMHVTTEQVESGEAIAWLDAALKAAQHERSSHAASKVAAPST